MRWEKRHTCCICKRKRIERNMTKLNIRAVNGFAWACSQPRYYGNKACREHDDISIMQEIIALGRKMEFMKIKNY